MPESFGVTFSGWVAISTIVTFLGTKVSVDLGFVGIGGVFSFYTGCGSISALVSGFYSEDVEFKVGVTSLAHGDDSFTSTGGF